MPASDTIVRLLASVTDATEARLALALGADLIDAKNPAEGALGALPFATVEQIVVAVSGRRPVSATIGDLAFEPELVVGAVRDMAATGVDIVKVGLFPGGDCGGTLNALGDLRFARCRLVAVLLADRKVDLGVLPQLARAGFFGAMLDTAEKSRGALCDVISEAGIAAFLEAARRHGLVAGLAGSLRLRHVPQLVELGPDILGFRGALCAGNDRSARIDPRAFEAIRAAIPRRAVAARADALEFTGSP